VAQLSGGDEAVAVLVENLEGLLELLLRVGILFSTTAAKSQGEQTSKRDQIRCTKKVQKAKHHQRWRVRAEYRVPESHLHLLGHQGQELGEVNGTVAVGIDLIDHVLKLSLRGVLAEGAHNGAKLLGCDGACRAVEQDLGTYIKTKGQTTTPQIATSYIKAVGMYTQACVHIS